MEEMTYNQAVHLLKVSIAIEAHEQYDLLGDYLCQLAEYEHGHKLWSTWESERRIATEEEL